MSASSEGSGRSASGTALRLGGLVGLGALAVQYVPATVTLGQWGPVRSIPGGWCRWWGPPGRQAVALTFDDGPDPSGTPAMLDRLDELGLRGTFFVLASEASRHPELVGEIQARGHGLASHGTLHEHHLARTPGWVSSDLDRARGILSELGVSCRWYRPSFGQATGATLWAARRQGWEPVLWSSWGREWTTDDANEVAGRITRRLQPGAIVLLHDSDRFGRAGMWRVGWEALESIAQILEARGLASVTLDQLCGGVADLDRVA